MNSTRGQHFVQVALLSNFSINPLESRERRRILTVTSKEISKKIRDKKHKINVISPLINDICKSNNFLTQKADEKLTQLEIDGFPIIKEILSQSFEYEVLKKEKLYYYIASQNLRTLRWRDIMNFLKVGLNADVDLSIIQSEIVTFDDLDNIFYNLIGRLSLLNPIILLNKTEINFLMTDNPADDFFSPLTININQLLYNFTFFFLISPKVVIFFERLENKQNLVENFKQIQITDPNVITRVNNSTVRQCNRFVFAKYEEDIIKFIESYEEDD